MEVSTNKYHILGLNINPNHEEFQDFLAEIRKGQKKQCYERIQTLQNHGIPITMEKLENTFPESRLGKYNILMAMVADPECNAYLEENNPKASPDEILYAYLGKGSIAGKTKYRSNVSSGKTIELIHEAGGLAILAHPFKEVEDMSEMDRLLDKGLDGLEIQPNYKEKNNPYEEYANEHGIIKTYGSDWHGAQNGRRPLLRRDKNQIENLDSILNRWSNVPC